MVSFHFLFHSGVPWHTGPDQDGGRVTLQHHVWPRHLWPGNQEGARHLQLQGKEPAGQEGHQMQGGWGLSLVRGVGCIIFAKKKSAILNCHFLVYAEGTGCSCVFIVD